MSVMLPIPPQVAPLLGKLGSYHDPEVLAAVRALRRVLDAAGLTFNDLALALGPVAEPEEAERVRWWAELAGLAERRGYRHGWVAYTFAARFGDDAEPPWPEPEARMPSAEVQRWCRNRAARWARAQTRGSA